MERAVELEWREIIAHLDDAPAPSDDTACTRWALALGVLGLIPLAAPELLLASLPFAAGALLLGVVGLRRAAAVGRGRTRAGIALLLGAAPVATVFLVGALAVLLVTP